MDIKFYLNNIGLSQTNSIVIGSGILNALKIRKAKDIDVVVDKETFNRLLKEIPKLKIETNLYGNEILTDGLFEIGKVWHVLGEDRGLSELLKESIDIEGVNYLSLEFYLKVKRSWVQSEKVRQKDLDDVKLIEDYIKK